MGSFLSHSTCIEKALFAWRDCFATSAELQTLDEISPCPPVVLFTLSGFSITKLKSNLSQKDVVCYYVSGLIIYPPLLPPPLPTVLSSMIFKTSSNMIVFETFNERFKKQLSKNRTIRLSCHPTPDFPPVFKNYRRYSCIEESLRLVSKIPPEITLLFFPPNPNPEEYTLFIFCF